MPLRPYDPAIDEIQSSAVFRPYDSSIDGDIVAVGQKAPNSYDDAYAINSQISSASLAKTPQSVLEGTIGPFDFKASSKLIRKLDDQTQQQKDFATIGPITGPAPSVGSVIKGLGTSVVAGAKRADAGLDQMISDAFGSEYAAGNATKKRAQAELLSAANTPAFESDTAKGVYGGLSSVAQMAAPLAAAALTRSPSVALGGMVAPMIPDEYGKFRGRGADPLEAAVGATGMAGVEYLTEKTPMGFLVNSLGKVGTAKLISGFVARDAMPEQVATLTQDAIDTAIANPNKTWGEYLAERPQAAYQTLVATAMQAGLMGGANAAINKINQTSANNEIARAIDLGAQEIGLEPVPQAVPQPIAQVATPALAAPSNLAPISPTLRPLQDGEEVLPIDAAPQLAEQAPIVTQTQPQTMETQFIEPQDAPVTPSQSSLAARLLALAESPDTDPYRAQQLRELALQAQAATDNPSAIMQPLEADQAEVLPQPIQEVPKASVQAIERALENAYGSLPAKLGQSVKVVQSEQDAIDAAMQARAARGGDVGADVRAIEDSGVTRGFYDPTTKQSFLIADALTPQTAPGVFMHETGVHLGALSDAVSSRARTLVTQGKGEFFDRVRKRMEIAGETSAEEAAAYLVEEFENDRTTAPRTVKTWFDRVRSDLKASSQKADISNFSESDIAASARLAAKRTPETAQDTGAEKLDFSRGDLESVNQPWTMDEPGTTDNFIRAIQNNKIDLKRVRDSINSRYGSLTDKTDAYLSEELYHGRVAARVDRLYDEHITPLLKKIAVAGKNAGVSIDDVNSYLHARHAPERNAAMQAINPGMQDNNALSGMSDAESASVLSAFNQSGKGAALKQIAADVDQLLEDTRTALVADGLEDADVVSAWEAAYKHYVPLQRDVTSSGTPKGSGFSIRGPESKRAVGSSREVVNILANIVAQAETAAIRAEKSIVGRSLLEMARTYPNPEFWAVGKAPTKPRINESTGLVERNAIDPLYQTADNVIMVKDYGGTHFIVFNKENERAMAVAKAMKNLGIDQMPKWLQIASKATRFMASLLTARNPEFWLTNFTRDIQGALLNLDSTQAAGLQTKVMANLPKAFAGMRNLVRGDASTQWSRYARELTEAGGTTGYMQSFDTSEMRMDDLRKEVGKMRQGSLDPRRLGRLALDFVDDYNNVIEGAVRLSVFQAARDAGVSTARAASIAKNISVNFNRKGNASTSINSLYMFFNAAVQGVARTAQAVATSRRTQSVAGALASIGFILDLANRLISGEDEETKRNRYDLIPEFEKTKNWIFMNPARPGEYVKVPMPPGFLLFPNAGRLLSEAIGRKDARNAAEYGIAFAGMVIDAVSPLGTGPTVAQFLLPSLTDPVLQITENKSFTGSPVYKSGDQFGKKDPSPAYTRHFENTPDVWKGASKMLNDITGGDKVKPGLINIEPDILKHVFYSMTGGPGRTLDQAIDATQTGARGKELTVNRVPMASRFYGKTDDDQRERVFYSEKKRAAEAKTTYDYFVRNGRLDEAKKIAEEIGGGDPARGRKMMLQFDRTGKSVQKINKQIRAEIDRDDGDPEKPYRLRQIRSKVVSDVLDEDE